MKKKVYVAPEMNIVALHSEDVITSSGNGGGVWDGLQGEKYDEDTVWGF